MALACVVAQNRSDRVLFPYAMKMFRRLSNGMMKLRGYTEERSGHLRSDIDYEEAALALRFARHLGPIHCTIYTNGIMTKQRPPNKTYVHPGVSALRMISTTPTNAAPREHRTRLFWNRELVRDVLTASGDMKDARKRSQMNSGRGGGQ